MHVHLTGLLGLFGKAETCQRNTQLTMGQKMALYYSHNGSSVHIMKTVMLRQA